MIEPHKQAEIDSKAEFLSSGHDFIFRKPFGPEWDSHNWVKWATLAEILHRLRLPAGAAVLDIGCGPGWTTLFLAEGGFRATGVDIAPAFVEQARLWAARWNSKAQFEVADMDDLTYVDEFDAAILFDALHHTTRQAQVVANVSRSLKRGGWAVFGEPSWLHNVSPAARRVHRETGWVERGVEVRALEADCRDSGLGNVRRFFEGTRPYEHRVREFGWQLIRLVAANLAFAPQASVWVVAQKL
ncbi:MAG: hypothetical protein V7644_190 [Actinomycetota bacterium]|jgi:SAM-dependent methyltransferase